MKNNYHIAIVLSEFNKPVTDQLLDGATRAFNSQSDGKLLESWIESCGMKAKSLTG